MRSNGFGYFCICRFCITRIFVGIKVESVHVHGDGSVGEELSGRVQKRYGALPYPRQDDIKAMWVHIKEGPKQVQTIFDEVFGGNYDFCKHGMRILVAGCGTGVNMVTYSAGLLAAAQPCKSEPEWELVCYDLSQSSLSIARDKARLGGFENHVRFIQGDILKISAADLGIFDFVVSTGVLHHISDTIGAFKILQSVLRRGGGMDIMLYAVHGRRHKDLFRMQNLVALLIKAADIEDEEARILRAASVHASLPSNHPHKHSFGESKVWEGVADLYLHPHEKNFDPKGIYEIVNNLTLDGFAVTSDSKDCPAELDGFCSDDEADLHHYHDVHMGLKWAFPDTYSLQKVAPGMIPPGILTPEEEAQAADLAHPTPTENHKFYLFTPEEWKTERYRPTGQSKPPRVPGAISLSPGDLGSAWAGLGRDVATTQPFGPPKGIDFNYVGQKNAKAYIQIGLPKFAKIAKEVASEMHRQKGVTDPNFRPGEREVLLTGSIAVGAGVKHQVVVYEGQSASDVAEAFAIKHGLDARQKMEVEKLVLSWIDQERKR